MRPLKLRLPSQVEVTEGGQLDRLLAEVMQQKASDLLLIAGLPPIFRINGRLTRMEERGALEGDEMGRLFLSHFGAKERQDLEERGNDRLHPEPRPRRASTTAAARRGASASTSTASAASRRRPCARCRRRCPASRASTCRRPWPSW